LEDDVRPFRSWFVCNSEPKTKEDTMPRYLVERSFPEGLSIPVDEGGAKTCQVVVDGNATEGVTWIQSYVTTDKQMTFCVYDGPSPEAIRRAAEANQLPVDRITEVRVLDPYFYR
jgi:Protein of unknown function (DUF4242)